MMRSYERMPDVATPTDVGVISCPATARFCSMGFVTSSKWFSCFVTIADGVFHLYDEERTFLQSPGSVVVQIPITRRHTTSQVKRKVYNQDGKSVELFCFYIEVDNGVFSSTREIKIGCLTRATADMLIRAIHEANRAT